MFQISGTLDQRFKKLKLVKRNMVVAPNLPRKRARERVRQPEAQREAHLCHLSQSVSSPVPSRAAGGAARPAEAATNARATGGPATTCSKSRASRTCSTNKQPTRTQRRAVTQPATDGRAALRCHASRHGSRHGRTGGARGTDGRTQER